MNKKNIDFKINDSINGFYQIPKFLFGDQFIKLSSTAKLLYALMKERHEISIKNGWVDKNGDIYHVMPQETMAKDLNVGIRTVRRALNQLVEYELIENTRVGVRQANRLYLNMVIDADSANNSLLKKRKRFNKQDYLNSLFLQLPRFLMERHFGDLSNDTKILYAILNDRMKLSFEKEFMKYDDEYYVISSRNELSEIMGVSKPTLIKAMSELRTKNLITEVKYGFGDHNKIFLTKTPEEILKTEAIKLNKRLQSIKSNPSAIKKYTNTHSIVSLERSKEMAHQVVKIWPIKKLKNGPSRSKDMAHQEVKKWPTSYTDFSYTDFSYTESNLSICLSLSKLMNQKYDTSITEVTNTIQLKELLIRMVNERLNYTDFKYQYERTFYNDKLQYLTSIRDIIVDYILIPESHTTVGNRKIPFELMAEIMIHLDHDKLTGIVERLFAVDYPIHNMRSYILSVIYSTSQSHGAQSTNYYSQLR